MKTIGYLLFAGFYYLYYVFCRPGKKRIFCIMTHDGSEDSSVGVVIQAIRKHAPDYRFYYIKKEEAGGRLGAALSFFLIKPLQLARSGYILQDNIFLPMAYLHFRKEVRVVQLWHGTGTIKKFGQSVNTGRLLRLEKKADRTITDLVVNSEYTKRLYQEAFGTAEHQMRLYGLPRTDIMFDREKCQRDLETLYGEYPQLRGKKLLLYAPTFRDGQTKHPKLALELSVCLEELPPEYVIGIRLHPFVARAFEQDYRTAPGQEGRVYNFSSYEDLNTLLFAADVLVTDYSSIIFEFSVLGKPMIFFAYDLEEFSEKGRGFYEEYEAYVPGPVVNDTAGVIRAVLDGDFDRKRIESFCRRHYAFLDGKSTERVLKKIFHITC